MASANISAPLRDLILEQNHEYSFECLEAQVNAKRDAHKQNRDIAKSSATTLRATIPKSLQRAMALSWLTSLPLEEFGLTLHKGAFRDAIALRYGWQPLHAPTSCACGTNFSVEHALSCPMGGFPTIRHNKVRDLTANLMTEVWHDVCTEPTLQPITGEALSGASAIIEDGARLDVVVSGGVVSNVPFSTLGSSTHMLLRIDNPSPLATENLKRAYEQRVREVEHGSFTPLVMSLTGCGLGNAATVCYRRLASLLSAKWDQPYSRTIAWIRCSLSFSLLRSSILCARSARGRAANQPIPPVDLVSMEAKIGNSL